MEKIDLKKRERWQATGMQVRENEDGAESREIEGCAIVFGKETTLWDGKYSRVREIIDASCVTPEFLAGQDIKLNLLHDRSMSLARNNKGEGTLRLEIREDGLYFRAEMPKCDLGDQALELIRNKTYSGCSFEFWPQDYDEEVTTLADGREDCLITHRRFKSIDAVTIAIDPAYQQTSVGLREQMEKRESELANDNHNDNDNQRERERLTRERALRELQSDMDADIALMNRDELTRI